VRSRRRKKRMEWETDNGGTGRKGDIWWTGRGDRISRWNRRRDEGRSRLWKGTATGGDGGGDVLEMKRAGRGGWVEDWEGAGGGARRYLQRSERWVGGWGPETYGLLPLPHAHTCPSCSFKGRVHKHDWHANILQGFLPSLGSCGRDVT
jgi:hypothetical protein